MQSGDGGQNHGALTGLHNPTVRGQVPEPYGHPQRRRAPCLMPRPADLAAPPTCVPRFGLLPHGRPIKAARVTLPCGRPYFSPNNHGTPFCPARAGPWRTCRRFGAPAFVMLCGFAGAPPAGPPVRPGTTPKACVFWFASGLILLAGLNPVRMSAVVFCRRQPGSDPSGMHVLLSLLHYFVAKLYKSCIIRQYQQIFNQDIAQLAHCPARGSRLPTPPLPWRASISGPVLVGIPPRAPRCCARSRPLPCGSPRDIIPGRPRYGRRRPGARRTGPRRGCRHVLADHAAIILHISDRSGR